jgi:predicted nuclease of predicted toxin-antitoxin system
LAPSVILLRRSDKRPASLAAVIIANLGQVEDDLTSGAVVVIGDHRVRSRLLPVKRGD